MISQAPPPFGYPMHPACAAPEPETISRSKLFRVLGLLLVLVGAGLWARATGVSPGPGVSPARLGPVEAVGASLAAQ